MSNRTPIARRLADAAAPYESHVAATPASPLVKPDTKSPRRAAAFTLIELLVVIGIIIILIGILIPTISRVRIAVQTVNTRQMISRLEAGINSYYSDFGAYPGPFGNSQVRTITGGPNTNINGASPAQAPVTSSENLYLALYGGLTLSPTFSYSATAIGPGNLNPANIKRYGQYIDVNVNETTTPIASAPGQWCKVPTATFGDTGVPEFLDAYASPSPVLYMRANRGATGFVDTATAYSNANQYQLAQIQNTYAGVRNTQNANWSINTSDYPTNGLDGGVAGSYQYMGNSSISTGAVPYQKDGYILISAGPDGQYGTRDDITNFRQ